MNHEVEFVYPTSEEVGHPNQTDARRIWDEMMIGRFDCVVPVLRDRINPPTAIGVGTRRGRATDRDGRGVLVRRRSGLSLVGGLGVSRMRPGSTSSVDQTASGNRYCKNSFSAAFLLIL